MFLFNKGHGLSRPESRQSFVDTHEADLSSSSLSWGQESHGDKSSPSPTSSRQERSSHGKRNSLLVLRSRSDTTTSSSSSYVSRASTMTGTEDSSRRASQDLRNLTHSDSSLVELADPKAKTSLFSRGKKLRRRSRLGGADDADDHDFGKRLSVLRRDSSKRAMERRPRISSPFDFQHLTHTQRGQLNALNGSDNNDLAAEFWAVRHSQMPKRELTGIKADDLNFGKFTSSNVYEPASPERSNPPAPIVSPKRLSPQRSYDQVSDGSPSPTISRNASLRQSRSAESFSQPKIRSSIRASATGINPPPRVSSRQALSRIDDEETSTVDASTFESGRPRFTSKRSSGFWQNPLLMQQQMQQRLASPNALEPIIAESEEEFTHAVTTVGDAAVPSLSPAFALENVPEEPESYFNPRPAPSPPVRHTPIFEESQGPHVRRPSASSRPASRLSRQGTIRATTTTTTTPPPLQPHSPRSRPSSQMSTTLGAPFSPKARSNSPPRFASLRRQSILQEFDASWEDDIDYCYDHAAEADCEYDWDRNSLDLEDRDRANFLAKQEISAPAPTTGLGLITEEDDTLRTQFFPGAFRPSLLVPESEYDSLPDLAPRSALSASTIEQSLLTPSDGSNNVTPAIHTPSIPYYEVDGFDFPSPILRSSMLSQDMKYPTMRDDMYDELLADYQSSDRHYPILDATHSMGGSSLSSATRLSKRSSYDSSIRSGSGSLYSSIRRSASSSGSLPDLIHSRRSTKRAVEESVEFLADQLSFANLEAEEDEETTHGSEGTPTNITEVGQPSLEGTFFATEEDEHARSSPFHRPPTPGLPSSPELVAELPKGNVLELDLSSLPPLPKSPAPQPIGHHERASSEGAAKLLSFGTSSLEPQRPTRQRSSSQSQSRRVRRPSAYTLSLFPSPPPSTPKLTTVPTLPNML